MPIPVVCPSCSASFRVKDEVAGKRAKCPKCGEPLTIPTAFQAAETMLEPPSVKPDPAAPKPKSPSDAGDRSRKPKVRRDDDAEERPRSKKRADDEEEEKPRARKRQEDDDEDRPTKKLRRDEDDDRPKKKGSALPLILGILGGVLVLCGGGCAGVWFGVIAPAAEQARKLNDEKQAELDRWEKELNKPQPNAAPTSSGSGDRKYTQDDMNKVRAGMTLAQVEELLGKSRLPDDFDMLRAWNGPDAEKAWGDKRKEKAVLVWGSLTNTIHVAFTAPPANGGTVVGVRGVFGVNVVEPIKLPGGGGNTAPPTTGQTQPPATVAVSADALAKEFDANPQGAETKYKGKELKVTGVIGEIPKDAVSFTFQGANPPATKAAIVVPVIPKFGGWGPIKKMKAGDTVTATGKFESFNKGKGNAWEIRLVDCTINK